MRIRRALVCLVVCCIGKHQFAKIGSRGILLKAVFGVMSVKPANSFDSVTVFVTSSLNLENTYQHDVCAL